MDTNTVAAASLQAPHPTLENATFMLDVGNVGAQTELVFGWPGMLDRLCRLAVDYRGPDALDTAQRDRWDFIRAGVEGLNFWRVDDWGNPLSTLSLVPGGSYAGVYRVGYIDHMPAIGDAPEHYVPLRRGVPAMTLLVMGVDLASIDGSAAEAA